MNIKSLILGSAAALVAGGAAQAADLPVAEPVDYVKVCDAYGSGYFFIPGTDTCLKIAGKVLFAIDSTGFDSNVDRADALVNFYTETTFKFTAREETELGTLTAHMEFDDKGDGTKGSNTAFDKAYIQLGGFYAGLTDALLDVNAGHGYDDFGYGMGDLNVIGYKADMGNGVELAVALEEYTENQSGAGTSMPAFSARVKVKQGWGEAQVAGSVHQLRWTNPSISTDIAYGVGAKAVFNVVEGVKFGVAGGYGTQASTVTDGKVSTSWAASTGLEYAFADNFTFYVDAGIKGLNDEGTSADWKAYGTSAKFSYKPVKNLAVKGKVGYYKYDAKSGTDWDDVAARLEIERSF